MKIECKDCNWTGSQANLTKKNKTLQDEMFLYCPTCGSDEIKAVVEIKKGLVFTGLYFKGRIEVLQVDKEKNTLKVKLQLRMDAKTDDNYWFEDWVLSHTEWGFKKDEYYFIKYLKQPESSKSVRVDTVTITPMPAAKENKIDPSSLDKLFQNLELKKNGNSPFFDFEYTVLQEGRFWGELFYSSIDRNYQLIKDNFPAPRRAYFLSFPIVQVDMFVEVFKTAGLTLIKAEPQPKEAIATSL